MRLNLVNARKGAKLTQSEIADRLIMTVRQYQRIESGKILGKVDMWDTLEDLFDIPQRRLRKNYGAATPTEKEPDGNQAK